MRTPTTIAFAGDWHADFYYATPAIEWAHQQGVDTIVHVGDFGYRFVDGFSRDFITKITRVLKHHDMELYFVDGNHDNHEYLAGLPTEEDGTRTVSERVHYLPRGLRWTWGTVDFLAMGGAYSVDRPQRTIGESWWPGEVISGAESYQAGAEGKTHVLISHDCPDGVSIPGLEEGVFYFGQEQIDRANEARQMLTSLVLETEPNAIFCGHFHVRYDEAVRYNDHTTDVHILNCNGTAYTDNMYVTTLEQLEIRYV